MERWILMARQIGAVAWRKRWLFVATSWVVCLLGWTAVSFVPDIYESQARLYVDTDAILTPLLHGLAIDTATANQLELMQKTLLSRPNLDKLVSTTDLEIGVTTPQAREALIAGLGQEIKVTAEARNLFTVRYRNKKPRLARDVVASLVNIFLEGATGSNRSEMANAQRFLNEQITAYEAQLRAAEQRRADFRKQYLDILPLESNGGVSRLESARANVRELETGLRDALAKRTALQEETRTTPALISAGMIGTAGAPATAAGQLAVAEAKLADLRTKYTEQHPDVVGTRQLVESLRQAARSSSAAPVATGGGGISNPVYEQIKVRLVETEANVASLQSRLEVARKDLDQMEQLARAAPQVEAQYENLDRDYNVIRKNYDELLARRESSRITAAADTGADKVRMRIIDPPQITNNPISPNRLLLYSAVLMAGFATAVGVGILLHQTDRSVQNLEALREFGFPVLGGISMVESAKKAKFSLQQAGVAIAVFTLVIVYGGLVTRVLSKARFLL